eukprot:SAG22_NODE_4801_length_1160_cov_1.154571_2_plen_190_part_00
MGGVADLCGNGQGNCGNRMAIYDLMPGYSEGPETREQSQLVVAPGCTDPRAANYDAAAVENDGSCVYDCAALVASDDADDADHGNGAGCYLVGGSGSDQPAPQTSAATEPARLVVQGLMRVELVEVEVDTTAGNTNPYEYEYIGCFIDSADRDMIGSLDDFDSPSESQGQSMQERLDGCWEHCTSQGFE